jgi:hypothetical protein
VRSPGREGGACDEEGRKRKRPREMKEEMKSAGDCGQEPGRDRHQAVTHEKEEKKKAL